MKINAWSKTDTGRRRESNQDSFLINHDLGLYIVADGMGGHSGGEVASSLAVQNVEKFIAGHQTRLPSSRELLSQAYLEASHQIYDRASHDSHLLGMGTTMVAVFARGPSLFIANVGDSRVYLSRGKDLWQLTEDHSLVFEQLRAGMINENQLKTFVGKNVITRSVGYEREINVDILERPLTSGDRFLLCSDGLSGLVEDVEIAEILNQNPPGAAVEICISRALANGGDDNVTVVLVEVA